MRLGYQPTHISVAKIMSVNHQTTGYLNWHIVEWCASVLLRLSNLDRECLLLKRGIQLDLFLVLVRTTCLAGACILGVCL